MDDGVRESFGTAVRRLREQAGLTQLAVAGRVRRSRSWVTRLETGRVGAVGLDDVYRLADALGTKAWALLLLADQAPGPGPEERLQVVADVVAWAAEHPQDWALAKACVQMAYDNPEGWRTLRMLLGLRAGVSTP